MLMPILLLLRALLVVMIVMIHDDGGGDSDDSYHDDHDNNADLTVTMTASTSPEHSTTSRQNQTGSWSP